MTAHAPPGWPAEVPPPGVDGWREQAVPWLLDQCPADFRGYDSWRRHPAALAWVAVQHVEAQLAGMRAAYRQVRVALGETLMPEALRDVMTDLEAEGVRLRGTARAVHLVHEAMQGATFVPRL
ncbi:hypothetical protein [Arsenicicoccus dermatophilus]|uniref:hypothetical protein n=1 Tax=Arsenicicoccus dermatophilus TaxID=1076331 RepID=UPI001F4CED08|nr:hypothetical protein [Arsenicicoccus dermatophilus]MCH8612599.1 hypothetical protein [Arsenicicoccus dermatophilus]